MYDNIYYSFEDVNVDEDGIQYKTYNVDEDNIQYKTSQPCIYVYVF